jgi:signal transduction histidine kinase
MNSLTHGLDVQNDGKITIKAFEDKQNIVITYEDNGVGIKKENLSKIFEPFFTTNRNFGGNGLGLNLVYNIVTTQLHGTIICKSEPNKGTKFIITLPKNTI